MNRKHYIIPIFVPHRGCPHDCIFCNQRRITGDDRDISYTDVVNTIESYLCTMDRENSYIEVSFFGGSFTGIPMDYQNELLKAAKEACDSGKIDTIRLSTRPDYINSAILDNLKKYSVGVIELGVQSMDEYVLKIAERGHSKEDVIEASKLIKEYGIMLGLQMMVGLPGDNEAKDMYTAEEIIRLKPDFVRIYPALVIKDTYMELMYKNNQFSPISVDDAVEACKKLYIEFTKHNINIIRIGLQPTEEINLGKDVVAGPFHPSFRELVESSILNDMAGFVIKNHFNNSNEIGIEISNRDISKLYAEKKKFFLNKIKEFPTQNIKIQQNSNVPRGSLLFTDGEKRILLSINEYANLIK